MDSNFGRRLSGHQKQLQQALIESWACSLAELYDASRLPLGGATEVVARQQQHVTRQLCLALMDHYEYLLDEGSVRSKGGSELMSTYIQQLAQTILDLADQKWQKAHPTLSSAGIATKTTTALIAPNSNSISFSWFDQLQTFSPRVMVEDIENASSLPEQVQLLLRVDYIEDVSMDWKLILPILQRGLQSELQESKNDSVDPIPILHLVKTWYRQCRSSPDLVSLQYDLCAALMEAILRSNNGHTSLFQLWHDMWVDVMTFFYDTFQPSLERMEWLALLWLRLGFDVDDSSPLATLSKLDPAAKWCSCWMVHFMACPYRVLPLLQQSSIIPVLFAYCDTGSTKTASTDVRIHCLAMLCSILRTTRALLFPWSLLNASNIISERLSSSDILAEVEKRTEVARNSDDSTSSEMTNVPQSASSKELLFDLFWNEVLSRWKEETEKVGAVDAGEDDDDVIRVLIDGLGVIMWGCWTEAEEGPKISSLLPTLLSKIEHGLDLCSHIHNNEEATGEYQKEHFQEKPVIGRCLKLSVSLLLETMTDLQNAERMNHDSQNLLLEIVRKATALTSDDGANSVGAMTNEDSCNFFVSRKTSDDYGTGN